VLCHNDGTDGKVYTDQTGKFVAHSANGNNYLLTVYEYDSNAILAEPLNSRTATAIVSAYKAVHAQLCTAGLRPQLQRFNNECSAILKESMKNEEVDFELVPPGMKSCNAAERAILTFMQC
jgi:hypothetical protein